MLLEYGEIVHSDFSGVMAPETVKHIQQIVQKQLGFRIPADWLQSWRTCDIDTTCLRVQQRSANFKIRHVFKDVCRRMPEEHRIALDRLRPELTDKGKPVDLAKAKYQYHQMQKYLLEHGREMFGRDKCSNTCMLHPNKRCQLSFKDPNGPFRPLTSSYAGPMCTPWSAFGSKWGEGHPCMESYLCWMEVTAVNNYNKVAMEHNEWIPLPIFRRRFAEQARVLSIVPSPSLLGYPIHRRRLFVTALSFRTLIWLGLVSDSDIYIDFL